MSRTESLLLRVGPFVSDALRHPPTVWVVDDDRAVASAVARVLRSAALEARSFVSAAELLDRLGGERPDCLVLDLWLGDTTGLELLPRIQERVGLVPVVFMSGSGDVRSCVQAMRHGAIDFLEKPLLDGPLLDAVIRGLARGQAWREARAAREAASQRFALLTRREREVFALVASGKPNKRIAVELGTTEKTIKVHRGRVMQKLGASSLVDLVHLAQSVDQLAV